MHPSILVALLFYPFTFGMASAEGVDNLIGLWRTARHGALGNIDDCGNATPCGVLVWASKAVFQGNTRDVRNPKLALRNRPLIGVPILWGFQPNGLTWKKGRIYNPEDGKTFRANLQLLTRNELRVTGCIGPLCRSQIWTRSNTK